MRVPIALIVLAATASASPRKPLSDKYARAAGAAFAKARAADAAHNTGDAIAYYTKAFEIVPAPEAAFNLAEVQYESGAFDDAITNYDLYLALAPQASDRASVEKTIDEIEHLTGTLVVEPRRNASDAIEVREAYVFVDGVLAQVPGNKPTASLVVRATQQHQIDVITALTQDLDSEHVEAHKTEHVETHGPARVDGNVVVSVGSQLHVFVGGTEYREQGGRRAMQPGKHRVAITDGMMECAPITIDVPAGETNVLYLHVHLVEPNRRSLGCRALAVVQKVLSFK